MDGWKSQILSNVLSACADADQDAWISWLGEAFKLHPDIPGKGDSCEAIKRLNAMINFSEDGGREVGLEIKVMALDFARQSPPKIMNGRQITREFPEFHADRSDFHAKTSV